MLILGGITALDVAERGVRLDDVLLAEVFERHQVLGLAESVQPAPAERQGTEVLVDDVQQLLRPVQPVGADGTAVSEGARRACVRGAYMGRGWGIRMGGRSSATCR